MGARPFARGRRLGTHVSMVAPIVRVTSIIGVALRTGVAAGTTPGCVDQCVCNAARAQFGIAPAGEVTDRSFVFTDAEGGDASLIQITWDHQGSPSFACAIAYETPPLEIKLLHILTLLSHPSFNDISCPDGLPPQLGDERCDWPALADPRTSADSLRAIGELTGSDATPCTGMVGPHRLSGRL